MKTISKTILFTLVFISSSFVACAQNQEDKKTTNITKMTYKVQKTEEEWKKELTPEQYSVLREKGTERPFTGEYEKTTAKGTYHCAACGAKLFESGAKFDSHCGWPSFDDAIKGSVIYNRDVSHGMIRTEVVCATCGSHLGHVFDDGPRETTGQRYCINSVSMVFHPDSTAKK
ncbi:peptide-methionine (R)-S-oxide reductase MsrB [Solitalea koreensis]|uniref:peptide-methionine (R)-S-oxide reductase n=2 Tax=Solitalea koreensis TaxID=543615 RepID=A0A521AT80_9SPHI|nr:peptide-methionine (R)-S-oxide reductase MsrB [Solitalea koreensis]SMO38007.1 peptide-methionine (R)-S-oxide reductase [Solitalea koreensis]